MHLGLAAADRVPAWTVRGGLRPGRFEGFVSVKAAAAAQRRMTRTLQAKEAGPRRRSQGVKNLRVFCALSKKKHALGPLVS